MRSRRHLGHPDALEQLRQANPVDADRLPGPDSPEASALKEKILATRRPGQPPRRHVPRRRRVVVAVAAGLLAIASTATAWVLITRDVTQPRMACYEAASLGADRVGLSNPQTLEASECAPIWEEGTLTNPAAAKPGETPPLTACVTEAGTVAVFPSDDPQLCQRLGLAYPEPNSANRQAPTLALQQALIAYFANEECIPLSQAQTEVAEILRRHGFKGWDTEVMPGPSDRPCASFSLNAEQHVVSIIPIPDPHQG